MIVRTRRNGICVKQVEQCCQAAPEKQLKILQKMRKTHIFLLFAIGVWLSSCGTSGVITDSDPSANFSKYRTYKFTDSDDDNTGGNPLYHSSLIDNAIHGQIAIELEKRGFEEVRENPDLLITYHTYTEKKQSSATNYYPMMYGGWGWRYYPYGMAMSPYPFGYWNGYNRSYTEGTLLIDAVDAGTKQVVWRGSVSDAIDDPKDLSKKAIKAVTVIFSRFPIDKMRGETQSKILAKHK
jgi:hypothetical protein